MLGVRAASYGRAKRTARSSKLLMETLWTNSSTAACALSPFAWPQPTHTHTLSLSRYPHTHTHSLTHSLTHSHEYTETALSGSAKRRRSQPPTVHCGPTVVKFYGASPNQCHSWRRFSTDAKSSNRVVEKHEGGATKETDQTAKRLPDVSEIKQLMTLAHGEGPYIASAVALLLISSGVSLSIPMGMGHIIDMVVTAGGGTDTEAVAGTLLKTCIGLGGVFIAGAAANAGRIYLIQRSGQRIVKRLRNKLFAHLCSLDMAFFDEVKTGELVNRLSSDTVVVGKSLADNISDGLRSGAQGLVGISLMIYLCPKLAGTFLLVIPPISLIAAFYGRAIKKLSQETQTALGEASATADETLSNMYSVRASAQETGMIEMYSNKVRNAYDVAMRETVARSLFFGTAGLAGNLSVIAVLGYGGLLTAKGVLSIGDLSAFLMYTVYAGTSISGLASFHAELMKGIGASTRVFSLLGQQPHISGSLTIPLDEFRGNIEFEDVYFKYPTRPTQEVINGLNLQVPAGSTQALVGSSGSGKSTIFGLLLRLYDPERGSITIDGYNVKDIDTKWLREQIGTVEQNPVLFSGSIADNIKFGVSGASKEEVEDAAKKAYAHDFIQSFPDGYDTVVGERGVMLSGGQQQRIAIARAILKNPKILLLDEATSSLDTESEQYVQEALQNLMVGRTTLQIAHRLSTITGSDNVAVLENGKSAESGTYSELVERKKLFHDFIQRQQLLTS